MLYSKVLLLDIDGVAAIHMPQLKRHLRLPQIDGEDYGFPELKPDEQLRVFAYMMSDHYVTGCDPDPIIQRLALQARASGCEVYFLTARPAIIRTTTREWCNCYFMEDRIIHSNDKRARIEFMKKRHGGLYRLVDDLPRNVADCADVCDRVFCYHRENQDYPLSAPSDMIVTKENIIERVLHGW